MIILPDRSLSRSKFLMPVLKKEWMTPSHAQQKTFCGDEDRTRFRIQAKLNDGYVKWTGWFDDREDFDAFLYAIASGSLVREKELWKLPNLEWHPDIGINLTYDFLTQTILTTTGSNQTYTSPSDWNNNNNQIECLGGASSGGLMVGTGHATGGGGGAYSAITNFTFAVPGTTTATYRVGSGANGRTSTTSAGNAGSATWWNDTVDPGNGSTNAKCSAAAGSPGAAAAGSQNGGAGGASTSSWGQTKFSGGRGGNLTGASGTGGSGGGGAAGPAGAGGNGVDSSSTGTNVQTNGGSANNGTTAGGLAGTGSGSNGTEFDPSYGCGSASGGRSLDTATNSGGGGLYGAGSGGCRCGSSISASGAGRSGLIVVEYEPASAFLSNAPMLGM